MYHKPPVKRILPLPQLVLVIEDEGEASGIRKGVSLLERGVLVIVVGVSSSVHRAYYQSSICRYCIGQISLSALVLTIVEEVSD